MKSHFLEPLLSARGGAHHVENERTGSIVAGEIELAADSRSRNRGLLGRSGIAPGSVMIIAPCNAIHTFFMRFTIDIVFVDREGQVLKVFPAVRPWRVRIAIRAFAVLEMRVGSLDGSQIVVGDRLRVVRKSPS